VVPALTAARGSAQAEAVEPMRASLAGLAAVQVQTQPLPPEVEKAGLTTAQLRADVEARLTEAGLKVQGDPYGTTFYALVNVLPETVAAPPLTYSVTLELHQRCVLIRNPKILTSGVTWSSSTLISGGDVASIRARLARRLDRFVADYRAENARK